MLCTSNIYQQKGLMGLLRWEDLNLGDSSFLSHLMEANV